MSTRVEPAPDAPRTAPDPGRHPALLEHPVPRTRPTGGPAPVRGTGTTSANVVHGIYPGVHVLLSAGVRADGVLHPAAVAPPPARVAAHGPRGRRWTR